MAYPIASASKLISCIRRKAKKLEWAASVSMGADIVDELSRLVGERAPVAALHLGVYQKTFQMLESRLNVQYSFKIADRLIRPLQVEENNATVVKGFRMLRSDRDGHVIACQRGFKTF